MNRRLQNLHEYLSGLYRRGFTNASYEVQQLWLEIDELEERN